MRFYLRAIAYFREDLGLILTSLALIGLSTLAGVLQPLLPPILLSLFFAGPPSTKWIYRSFYRMAHSVGIHSDERVQLIILLAVLAVVLRVVQELLSMAQRLIKLTSAIMVFFGSGAICSESCSN